MNITTKIAFTRYMLVLLGGLLSMLLMNRCSCRCKNPEVPISQKISKDEPGKSPETPSNYDEVIIFFGNPGAGKSALLNSILQRQAFTSGISIGKGMTREKKGYIHENKKYIDTPGLSDIDGMEQVAQEIEQALKENKPYKIFFVVTLEGGRMRVDDLVTINKICGAIQVPFEYGLIFNKVSKPALAILHENADSLESYLSTLAKKPTSTIIIENDRAMKDRNNVYMEANAEGRKRLLDCITNLKATLIPSSQVQPIDVTDYQEKYYKMGKLIEEMQETLAWQKRELLRLQEELKKVKSKG
jgi:predicted GTPase